MSSNRVINHNTYVEITNGLFFVNEIIFGVGTDDPEEFTFRQAGIQIVPKENTRIINQLEQYEFVSLTRQHIEEAQRQVERARIENERLSLDLSNMSEQQLLEHFDRISQEE